MNNQETGTKEDLVKYRLEKAYNDLLDANLLIAKKSVTSANNRLYYSVFHAITAIHALDNVITKKHNQAIGEFNKTYINNKEVFSREYGRKIKEIQSARITSDYDDFVMPDLDETIDNQRFVETFLDETKKYCEERLGIKISIHTEDNRAGGGD